MHHISRLQQAQAEDPPRPRRVAEAVGRRCASAPAVVPTLAAATASLLLAATKGAERLARLDLTRPNAEVPLDWGTV